MVPCHWCPPEAPFSYPRHYRVGEMPSRKADQFTLDSKYAVHESIKLNEGFVQTCMEEFCKSSHIYMDLKNHP